MKLEREAYPFALGIKTVFLWACLLLFCGGISAFALEVLERPDGRVTDRTGTLTRSQIANLEANLADFERETTNQLVVVLLPSLQGDSLEDYSIRLAEKWKIGRQGKNNGIILLIFKNDRKLRIEVGYGLEGALPDALAGSIIRNEIAPLFKDGRLYEGILAGVEAISAAAKGEYKASKKQDRSSEDASLWPLLLIFLVFGILSLLTLTSRRRHYHSGASRGWTTGGGFFGGGSSWGGGSGGGGFSGGGGDFGGGGSSGSW